MRPAMTGNHHPTMGGKHNPTIDKRRPFQLSTTKKGCTYIPKINHSETLQ